MNRYDLVIFDLDGTLSDTSPGIFGSVRYAEEKMGLSPVPDTYLRKFVGPPPAKMYEKTYGLTKEEALEAATFHREYGGKKGLYESEVYPGMRETLAALKNAGMKLAVATLKKEETAKALLHYHDILMYFGTIRGMDAAESKTKADVIREAVSDLEALHPVLIGDTRNDYEGAKAAGIDFIGVRYGFGDFDDTENLILADSPQELLRRLLTDDSI